jgi:hypothetical protein
VGGAHDVSNRPPRQNVEILNYPDGLLQEIEQAGSPIFTMLSYAAN